MKYWERNQWFHSSEFLRAATALHHAATTVHTHWLGHVDCKYISLRVDQRTGDFIFQNGSGVKLTVEQVYELFPLLREGDEALHFNEAVFDSRIVAAEAVFDSRIVAAGVRQYPE